MSKPDRHDSEDQHKPDVFDRIAEAFGFETTAGDRYPEFRYEELTVIYDRLHDLGEIQQARTGEEKRKTLRRSVSAALGFDSRDGRPLTRPEMGELAATFLDDPDVSPTAGSFVARAYGGDDEEYPSRGDLELVEELGIVQEWDEAEECVCVSRRQNSTRYHTKWTVTDGELLPACRGYSRAEGVEHRLAPENSISLVKDECEYCREGELRV